MTMKHNWLLAVVAAAALGLAGCGGGGSGSQTSLSGSQGSGPATPTAGQTQMAAIETAIETAQEAVAAINTSAPTKAQADAAGAAITAANEAIAAAEDVDDTSSYEATVKQLADKVALAQAAVSAGTSLAEERAAREAAEQEIADAEEAARLAEAEAAREAMAATGKALYSKLIYNNGPAMVPVVLQADGKIDIGDSTTPIDTIGGTPLLATDLAKQEAAAPSLTGWTGADYMKTGATKVTHNARVYSNQKAATQVSFISDDATSAHGLTATNSDDAYTVTSNAEIVLDDLGSSGVKTLTPVEQASGLSGSFMGAAGTYECPTGACSAAPLSGGGVTLVGTWTFTPNEGAMISVKDADYMQFGWWVRKDSDGDPTHASAFYGQVTPTGTPLTPSDGAGLTGSATFTGHAAGKFAVNNPLGTDSDGGHFTANAALEAKFGATTDANTNGLTGTIDGFRLNDRTADPGWSVKLNRAGWDGTSAYTLEGGAAADNATRTEIEGAAVQWSVGGTASPGQTGQWEAQLFDENGTTDNSNSPTTALGRFEAGFGGTHKMVGAFGATQE